MQIPSWTKVLFIDSIILSCLCLLGCSESPDEPDDDAGTVDPRLISANTDFGFKLFVELSRQHDGKNIFISPLSVSIALAMTYNGAEGETQQAMAETLELSEMNMQEVNQANAELRTILENLDPKVVLNIANSIWAREGREFEPDFLERNREFFGAEVAALDFGDPESADIINQWVNDSTNGMIEKIIESIDPQTVMYLINAIYFKGSWKVEFDKSRTTDGYFRLPDGTKKLVPMMVRSGEYPYYEGENFEAAKLPYGLGRVNMYIFLPDRSVGIDGFIGSLSPEAWESWMSMFEEVEEDSIFIMPRFRLEYESVLNNALKALGMGIAFSGSANFDGMASGLSISEVRHKAVVEVNEEGTEASAVTSVSVGESEGPFTFTVDRPFFFAIRDDVTGAILFMGAVMEP